MLAERTPGSASTASESIPKLADEGRADLKNTAPSRLTEEELRAGVADGAPAR